MALAVKTCLENVTRSSQGDYSHLRGYHLKGFLVFWAFPEGSLGHAQIPFQLLMLKSKKYFMLNFVHFPFARKPSGTKAQRLR